ncbi:hypothetical protein FACS189451_00450 [Bacteroidia bacterium]|nr:hypothetical protein FACS189451_00450 [Bacteroidia bacterium]
MPLQAAVAQAADLIDCELEIVKMELAYPERFVEADNAPEPLAKWTGKISDMLEIIIALFLTGLIRKPSGHKMNLAEVAGLFGKIFGVKPRDLYGRKSKLVIRKKNEAPFLDSLVFLYREEANK